MNSASVYSYYLVYLCLLYDQCRSIIHVFFISFQECSLESAICVFFCKHISRTVTLKNEKSLFAHNVRGRRWEAVGHITLLHDPNQSCGVSISKGKRTSLSTELLLFVHVPTMSRFDNQNKRELDIIVVNWTIQNPEKYHSFQG